MSATAEVGSFVATLALLIDPHVDAARILRTVRARAEGREVVEVETRWKVRFALGDEESDGTEAYARARARSFHGARVVRVTLTRRRTRKAT